MSVSLLGTMYIQDYLDNYSSSQDAFKVRKWMLDQVQVKLDEAITQVNTNDTDVASNTAAIAALTASQVQIAEVTLTDTEIVGTDAGDLGHADGAILVAAAGADAAHQFIGAVLIYDYDTAAYTDGGDDLVVNVGVTGTQVAHSAAIAGADLVGASGDKVVQVAELSATDQALAANNVISLNSTAWTQPGTAAGVLRCVVTYRTITLGL